MRRSVHAQSPRFRALGAAALVAVLCLAVAACSSDSSSTSTGSQGSSGGASSGAASSEVDAANAFLEAYRKAPTAIPLKESLAKPPTAGKTIVFLQCELAQCKAIGNGVKSAADVVGWTFQTIPYESTNPSTLDSAMDQSLQYNPVAVAFTSPPYALWSHKVQEFAAKGVALIPSFVGAATLDKTVIANVSSDDYAYRNGQVLANWFIADSGAKGNVLSVNTPDFPWLDSVGKGFVETVQKGCAACKVTKLDIGIPDLGSGAIIDQTVSALRSDPSIDYVAGIDAEFFLALPAAMKAAGISDSVKLFGCCSAKSSQTGLSDGSFVALTGVNGNYAGFITIDAALRFAEGSPVPANEGDLPLGLLLPGTGLTPSNSYDEPSDFVNQFKARWHLS